MMCSVLWVRIYSRNVDYLYYIYNFKVTDAFQDSLNLKMEDINHVELARCTCCNSMNLHGSFAIMI